MTTRQAIGASVAAAGLAAISSFGEAKSGAAAPDFKLKSSAGAEHALADFKGKYVVLEWTNFDCPFVRKHLDSNNLQTLQKTYTEKGVVWLTICSSAEGKQGHFKAERWNELLTQRGAKPTALLLDYDGTVGRQYGAKTTPHMFVVNPEGVVIYAGALDSKPTFDKDDVPGAENYVRKTLDAALSGKPLAPWETKPYGCSVKY